MRITLILTLMIIVSAATATLANDSKCIDAHLVKDLLAKERFHFISADTASYLTLAVALKNDNGKMAVEIVEQRIDIIICELWDNLHKMDEEQKNSALALLHDLKNYREKFPRNVNAENSPNNLAGDQADYAEKAGAILSALRT